MVCNHDIRTRTARFSQQSAKENVKTEEFCYMYAYIHYCIVFTLLTSKRNKKILKEISWEGIKEASGQGQQPEKNLQWPNGNYT
jgi:hypothetical protein